MKAKASLSNKHFQVRKISFNGILNSEYLFHRSGPLKMALNQDRILKRNYYIKRARSKVDQGKKPKSLESKDNEDLNISDDYRRNKTRIPGDLNNIIIKYDKKFHKQNEKFYNLKNDNDAFMNHWHYINDVDEIKERKLMLEKYFNDKDKHSINYYTSEVKKMCENIFKTSPLLIGNRYLDIFFFYLNEFNKNYEDKKKMAYIKQKIKKFLEKLKDLLDFVEVIKDTGIDSITKDVKMKNSRYMKIYEEKVRIERMKEAIKKRKENIESIEESKNMIKRTAETLTALEKNKNILDSDISPLNINSQIKKLRYFLSPIKTPYSTQTKFNVFSENKNSKMNSTTSTAFYLSGKGFYKNKTNNIKIFSGLNYKNQIKEQNDLISSIPKEKDTLNFYKLKPKKISISRDSPLVLENKEKQDYIKSSEEKKMPFNKIDYKYRIKNLTTGKVNLLTKISKDKIKSLNKNLTSINFHNISKRIKLKSKSQLSDKKRLSSSTQNDKPLEHDLSQKRIDTKNKTKTSLYANKEDQMQNDNINNGLINMKKDFKKNKSQLISLYDDIKKRKKYKEQYNEDIKHYFVKRGKIDESLNSLKSINAMDIIQQTKNIIDNMDIEQRTKKVFQAYITIEQLKKLDSVKDINKKVKDLDIEFIKQIIKYKSNKNDDERI